ncbi:N-terminal phage integrase SAM-like domain-containing protein [Tateyamaria sp. syn59]|uniref:N-terminal phage integrase SAM-like domain-containing protein n=1 Tax=Tateyamaria sp. syn59 TaxID=2576942 RepID=UPI001CB8E84F
MSLSHARVVARDLLGLEDVSASADISPTVAEFSQRYLADCAQNWKPATRRAHALDVRNRILPSLGDKRLDQLSRSDLENWKERLTCSAASGNRALAVLSGMMRYAELLGVQPRTAIRARVCIGANPSSRPPICLTRNGSDWDKPCPALKRRTQEKWACCGFWPTPDAGRARLCLCSGIRSTLCVACPATPRPVRSRFGSDNPRGDFSVPFPASTGLSLERARTPHARR